MDTITVQITGDEYLELLMNRLSVWTEDCNVHDLFREMYENYIECGGFDGTSTVMEIVDNDFVNYCRVIYSDDEEFEAIEQAYEDDEREYEINGHYYIIEAFDSLSKMALVRY